MSVCTCAYTKLFIHVCVCAQILTRKTGRDQDTCYPGRKKGWKKRSFVLYSKWKGGHVLPRLAGH